MKHPLITHADEVKPEPLPDYLRNWVRYYEYRSEEDPEMALSYLRHCLQKALDQTVNPNMEEEL